MYDFEYPLDAGNWILSDENKTVSIIGNDQIEGIQIVVPEEIST